MCEELQFYPESISKKDHKANRHCSMGRLNRFSRHVKPSLVIFASGLHQNTCQLVLGPAVSSGTPQTSPLLPRHQPAQPDSARPRAPPSPRPGASGIPPPRLLAQRRAGEAGRAALPAAAAMTTQPPQRCPDSRRRGFACGRFSAHLRQAPLGTRPAHDMASGGRRALPGRNPRTP